MVSRAERKALERAEELRREAEALLKSTTSQTVNAELKVRQDFESQLRALREEMDATSRRATVAESELELVRVELGQLRLRAAEAGVEVGPDTTGGSLEVPPLKMLVVDPKGGGITASTLDDFVARMSSDTDRLMQSAAVAASRMHSQAELDLARAKEEAVLLLRSATQEAEDLLAAAVAAIERDTAITRATREQAERDGEVAATLRAEAKKALEEVEAEGERIRAEAQVEAKRIIEAAERESAEALAAVRHRLSDEVVSLRKAMERTRDSFESFLEHQVRPDGTPEPAPAKVPDPAER